MSANYSSLLNKAKKIDQNFANEMDKYLGTGRTDLTATEQLKLARPTAFNPPKTSTTINSPTASTTEPQTLLQKKMNEYSGMTSEELKAENEKLAKEKEGSSFGGKLNALLSSFGFGAEQQYYTPASYGANKYMDSVGYDAKAENKKNAEAEAEKYSTERNTLAGIKATASMYKETKGKEDYDSFQNNINTKQTFNLNHDATVALDSVNRYNLEDVSSLIFDKYGVDGVELTGNKSTDVSNIKNRLREIIGETESTLKKSNYDYDSAKWYAEHLDKQNTYEKEMEVAKKFASKTPLASSLTTHIANIAAGTDFVVNTVKSIGHSDPTNLESYIPLQDYDFIVSGYMNTVREKVGEDIEKKLPNWQIAGTNLASFLYQTQMSVGDNLLLLATVGQAFGEVGTLAVMGSSAASTAMSEAVENGSTNAEAILTGLAHGAAEVITEKVSLDQLPVFDTSKVSIKTAKELSKMLLKQSVVEGSEEVASDLMNYVSDALILGSNSDSHRRIQQYEAEGLTSEQAKKKVFQENLYQTLWSGIGGFLSGFMMGGPTGAISLHKSNMAYSSLAESALKGKKSNSDDANAYDFSEEIQKGKALEKGSVGNRTAIQLERQTKNGKSPNPVLLGRLVAENMAHVQDNFQILNGLINSDVMSQKDSDSVMSDLIGSKAYQYMLNIQNGNAFELQLTPGQVALLDKAVAEMSGKYSDAIAEYKSNREAKVYSLYVHRGLPLKIAQGKANVVNKLIAGEDVSNAEIDSLNLKSKSDSFRDVFYQATGVRIITDYAQQSERKIGDVYSQARSAQYSIPPSSTVEIQRASEELSKIVSNAQAAQDRLANSDAIPDIPKSTEDRIYDIIESAGGEAYLTDEQQNEVNSLREELEAEDDVESGRLEQRKQGKMQEAQAFVESKGGTENLTNEELDYLNRLVSSVYSIEEAQKKAQQKKSESDARIKSEEADRQNAIDQRNFDSIGRENFVYKDGKRMNIDQLYESLKETNPDVTIADTMKIFADLLKAQAEVDAERMETYKAAARSSDASFNELVKRLNSVSKVNGKNITFKMAENENADVKKDDDGTIHDNGCWTQSTGTISFSRDMTTQEIIRWLLPHELLHQASHTTGTKIVDEMLSGLRDMNNKGLLKGYTKNILDNWDVALADKIATHQRFGDTGFNTLEDSVKNGTEELVADMMRVVMPQTKFWNDLVSLKKPLAIRISEKLRSMLGKAPATSAFDTEVKKLADKLDAAIGATEEQIEARETKKTQKSESQKANEKTKTEEQTTPEVTPESATEAIADEEAVQESYDKHSLNVNTFEYAKVFTGVSESTETAWKSLLRLSQIQSQIGSTIKGTLPEGHWRMNIHNINEYLAKNKDVWQELIDIQEESIKSGVFVDFVTPIQDSWIYDGREVEAGLKGIPIEYVPKEKTGGYKFNGFARTLGQMYLDKMDPNARRKMQDEFIAAVEDAYNKKLTMADPAPELVKMLDAVVKETEIRNIASRTNVKAQTALRSAQKTVAALNLNSACPMFTIGNHGCYLDACYLTQMGGGGNTVNLFQSAIYAGEILQLSQHAIDVLNADPDGLRVNGVGDTIKDNEAALFAALRHANMRGLKLKIITKQVATLELLRKAKKQGIDISRVTVQLSMDNLWIPAALDDAWGSGVRGEIGIAEYVKRGDFGNADIGYDYFYGRATKEDTSGQLWKNNPVNKKQRDELGAKYGVQLKQKKNISDSQALELADKAGTVWRKYGFTDSQVLSLVEEYSEINILPRYVVCTASEIAELALGNGALGQGPFIQTLMHGYVPAAARSDYPGEILNFGSLRHVVEKKNGVWEFYGARVSKNEETGNIEIKRASSKAHKAVDNYIKANYTKEQQETIYTNLQKQLCCKASEKLDACAGCQSLFGGGCSLCSAVKAKKNQNFKPDASLLDVVDTSRGVIKNSLSRDGGTDAEGNSYEFTDMPKYQDHTSAGTSLPHNRPTVYNKVNWEAGTKNLDIGGGKTEYANELLKENGVENFIMDPYNRDADYNLKAIDSLINGGQFDTVTCANVLNVIDSAQSRSNVILEAAKALKPDGTAYFQIYEGDSKKESGEVKNKPDQYQGNRKTKTYIPEIEQWFESVVPMKGQSNVLVATNPKANLPKAYWEYEEGKAVKYSLTEKEQKNYDKNVSNTTPGTTLYTVQNGSKIEKDPKHGIGKYIGGDLYFHNDADAIAQVRKTEPAFAYLFENAKKALEKYDPNYQYNGIRFTTQAYVKGEPNPKLHVVAFQEAPGFDTEPEPRVGRTVNVYPDGTVKESRASDTIWHHKWLWVTDDYKDFDTTAAWERSKEFLNGLTVPTNGSNLKNWNQQLKDNGLGHLVVEQDEEQQKFSLTFSEAKSRLDADGESDVTRGMNFNSAELLEQVLSGDKTLESRPTKSLLSNHRYAIIDTNPDSDTYNMVVGYVTTGKPFHVSAEEFHNYDEQHKVTGEQYDTDERGKWLYPLSDVKRASPWEATQNTNQTMRWMQEKHSLTPEFQKQFDDLIAEYGAQAKGYRDVREELFPKRTAPTNKVERSVRTIANSQATPEARVDALREAVVDGKFDYQPVTNKGLQRDAEDWLAQKKDFNVAAGAWLADIERGVSNPEMTARGAVLLNVAGDGGVDAGIYLQIAQAYARLLKTAGQTVEGAKIFQNMTPSGKLFLIIKGVEKINDSLTPKQKELNRDKFGFEEIQIPEELIDKYGEAQTDAERDKITTEIAKEVAKQVPSTFADRFTALRYLNMLGNVKTQVRNVVGNAMFQPIRMTKDIVASALESVFKTEKRTAASVGDKESFKVGLKLADQFMAEMQSGGKYNDDVYSGFSEEVRRQKQIFGRTRVELYNKTLGKALEGYRKVTNWSMEQGDVIFNKFAFADSIAKFMKANNTTWENASKSLQERAINKAIREAQESTYHDNNTLSMWVSSFARGQNTPKIVKLLAEGVLPFRKTPANILMRAYEYSPISIVENTVKSIQKGKGKSEISANDIINRWAKTLTGTGLVMLGYALAAMGVLIGKRPDDDKEGALFDQQGYQAYSLRAMGRNFTLDWLAPESIPMFLGANIAQAAISEGMTLEEGAAAIMAIGDPLLQMSMLQGINDALDNASSYGNDNALVSFITNAVWSYATQGLTNTFVGQIKRGTNNTRMTTYVDEESWIPKTVQRGIGKAIAKTPGISWNQVAYIDAWGDEEKNAKSGWGNFFTQIFSPAYVSEEKKSDMLDELNRLVEVTGDTSVVLQKPEKSFTYSVHEGTNNTVSYTKNMSAEEYVAYCTVRGGTSKQIVSDLISSKGYQKLSDAEKIEAINKAYDYATDVAKSEILPKEKALSGTSAKVRQGYVEEGIPEATYMTISANVANLKENWVDETGEKISNSNSIFKMRAIYDSAFGLTQDQIDYLAEALGVSKTVRKYNKNLIYSKASALERKYAKYN